MRVKFLIVACGIAICTAALVGGYNYVWIKRLTLERALDEMATSAKLIAPQIRASYDRMRNDATAVSHMPPFQGIVRSFENGGVDPHDGSTTAEWRDRLETIFASLMVHRPEYVQMRFIGLADEGRELVRTNRKNDVIQHVPPSELQSKAGERYFQQSLGLAEGEVHFSAVTPNRDAGKVEYDLPVLRVSAPVFDETGVLFGFMVINAHYGALLKEALATVSAGDELYVVNDAGDYVRRAPDGSVSDVILRDFADGDIAPVIAAMQAAGPSEAAISRRIEGREMVISQARAEFDPRSRDRYVGVVLAASRDNVLADAYATREHVLWLTGMLVLVVIAIAIVLSDRLTRPLHTAVRTIRSYIPGQTHLQLPAGRRDEIGALSRAFIDLVQRLEQAGRVQQTMLARLEAILDNSVDGIINIDEYGTVTTFNKGAAQIFGYSPEETIGRNVSMLMPAPIASVHDEHLRRAREMGKGRAIGRVSLFNGKTKDGRIIPIEISISEVNLPNGRMYNGIIRDITERKHLEEKLQQHAEALERSNLELKIARDQAEAGSRSKSDFLATMSHEIRTPMNAIIGMTELLLEEGLDDRQQQLARTVMTSAEALLEIINQILDFSKIESGKVDLEPLPFDLESVAEDVIDVLALKAREQEVDLLLRYVPGTPCHLVGDAGKVRQILFNLIGNAVKFTRGGRVLVTVEPASKTAPTVAGPAVVRISVRDSGIGVPAEKQEHIFERFAQSDTSTTRRFGGTGLGLSICKHLVSLMGGEIGVESPPGGGSIFWFTLKLEQDRDQTAPADGGRLRGQRMLVVDDDPQRSLILTDQLAAEEARCDVIDRASGIAGSLKEASREETPYSVVVVDSEMPGIDRASVERAATDPSIPETRFILLSGSSESTAEDDSGSGRVVRLRRPVRRSALLKAAESCLGLAGDTEAEIPPPPARQRPAPRLEEAKQASEPGIFPGVSVLLVEDNAVNRALMMAILGRTGCLVTVAVDGREAVEKVADQVFDIILMDCQMPVMDGFEASRIITGRMARHEIPAMPIIALTASAMKGDRERCLAAGMDDYLTKPIRMHEVVDTLRRWVAADGRPPGGDADTIKKAGHDLTAPV